jgi:hypothetical protein
MHFVLLIESFICDLILVSPPRSCGESLRMASSHMIQRTSSKRRNWNSTHCNRVAHVSKWFDKWNIAHNHPFSTTKEAWSDLDNFFLENTSMQCFTFDVVQDKCDYFCDEWRWHFWVYVWILMYLFVAMRDHQSLGTNDERRNHRFLKSMMPYDNTMLAMNRRINNVLA